MSPAIFLRLTIGLACTAECLVAETFSNPPNPQENASRAKKVNQQAHDGRIEFSYLYHTPEAKIDIIKEIAALGAFNEYRDFFIALFKTYQNHALQWMEETQVKPEEHPLLIDALWAGGLANEAIYRAQKAGWPAKSKKQLKRKAARDAKSQFFLQIILSAS